jgi:hypothetical protein
MIGVGPQKSAIESDGELPESFSIVKGKGRVKSLIYRMNIGSP